nr:hypothetical protein [Tanacetum cinerariifolium]
MRSGIATTLLFDMINIKTECFVVEKRMIGMRSGTVTTLIFDIKAKCFIIRKNYENEKEGCRSLPREGHYPRREIRNRMLMRILFRKLKRSRSGRKRKLRRSGIGRQLDYRSGTSVVLSASTWSVIVFGFHFTSLEEERGGGGIEGPAKTISLCVERPHGTLLSDTSPNPRGEIKAITTQSDIVLAGPSIPPPPLSSSKEKLMLPKLVPTRMTLELANRSVAYPVDIAKDVFVLVGMFTFPTDFVVIDYDVDPCVSLILGRSFLRMAHALVNVYGEELILRGGDKKLIFHADSTSKHPHKHGNESINMINFIDITCEDRFYEVLKIQKSIHPLSGNPTLSSDLVFESLSPSPTPFGDKKSSDSTTSHSDHSLSDYEAFCFDVDHIEEKSSGNTTSHSDLSLLEYKSFHFDLSIDQLPPANRNDFYHKEFADKLAHIISPPEYDHFYFDLEDDPGDLTRLLKEIISNTSTKDLQIMSLMIFLSSYPIVTLLFLKNFLRSIFQSHFLPEIKTKFSIPEYSLSKEPNLRDFIFFCWTIFLLSHTIDKCHILSEISLKIKSSVSFSPRTKKFR